MGALLEPTAVMGPWHVEVRSESAYLYGADANWRPGDAEPVHMLRVTTGPVDDPYGPAFAIPVADRDAVAAALDQIIGHPSFHEWATSGHVSVADVWRTEVVDGWLRVFGPVIVYGAGEPWRVGGVVELEYRHVAALLGALCSAQQ